MVEDKLSKEHPEPLQEKPSSYFEQLNNICIDFDGVVHKYSQGWQDGIIYDKPMEGAKDSIDLLRKRGYKVIISTARENLDEVRKWLEENGIIVDSVTNAKVPAHCYLDDKAIRFTSWKDFINYYV